MGKIKDMVFKKIKGVINKNAYSLVETLVGITVMAVVILGFIGMFLSSTMIYSKGKANAQSSNQLFSLIESKDKQLKLSGSGTPLQFSLRTKSGGAATIVSGLSMKLKIVGAEVVLGKIGGSAVTLGTASSPVNIDAGELTSYSPSTSLKVGWFEEMQLVHFRHAYVRLNGDVMDKNIANFYKIGSVNKAQSEIDNS